MDWNTIYEAISPYIGTGAIATAIITILAFAFKFLKVIKEIKTTFANTENEALKMFKNAIPKELYVSLETITKTELGKIVEGIKQVVDEKFLSPIKANTELTRAIASALITMKSIPDSCKKEIARWLEIKEVETTSALKVDLLEIKEKKEATTEQILID